MNEILELSPINNRQELLNLRSNELLGRGTAVNYIYFLFQKTIQYPRGNSSILYVGEAMRESENTGIRFVQHIANARKSGADSGNNLILTQYFHNKWKLGLKIFEADDNRKLIEREMIYWHIDKFGAPPIAQGKIPNNGNGKNRNQHIFDYITANESSVFENGNTLNNINKKQCVTQHEPQAFGCSRLL